MSTPSADVIEQCMREPIHLSGAIQPHGYLVTCTLPHWTIAHVSANVEALLGAAPDQVLGHSAQHFLPEEVLQAIADEIACSEPGDGAKRVCVANVGLMASVCEITAHQSGGLVHIEIEPQLLRGHDATPTAAAQAMIARIGGDDDAAFHQRVAEQVRLLTGYDRVMVYRFLDDDSGEVVAESRADDMEAFLGLRYPASDIPPQARRLYLRNRLRVIPDAGYTPVPVVPAVAADGAPIDMSFHVLRSVAPVHLEYLRNMGVAASMSISIVCGNRLWGLIACHHRAPCAVPPAVRASADLVGMFVSMRVAAREQDATMARYEAAQQVRETLAQRLAMARNFEAALADQLDVLAGALDSDGAALWMGGEWQAWGRAPASFDPTPLFDWLRSQDYRPVACSDRAAEWNVPALAADGLAGVLAINLRGADDWLFVFRAEQVEQVRWAGEPAKAMVATDDGQRIAPRRSFATWLETVRGRSRPWRDVDRQGAERLRRVLREQQRRTLAHREELVDLDLLHQRQVLGDQKRRLDHLSILLGSLIDLDPSEASRIDARIRALEADLRRLMQQRRQALEPG